MGHNAFGHDDRGGGRGRDRDRDWKKHDDWNKQEEVNHYHHTSPRFRNRVFVAHNQGETGPNFNKSPQFNKFGEEVVPGVVNNLIQI